MRVRRGLLFWGLFLIPLGGVPLLVRAGLIDPDLVANAWRLWPLLLVAFGLTMILGRSRAGIVGTIVAALALGTVAGGALAAGAPWLGNVGGCGASGSDENQRFERQGTFAGSATVALDLDCGSLDVGFQPGSDWQVIAMHSGRDPQLDETVDSLEVHSPDGFGERRQDWTIRLPADQTRELKLTANASTGSVALGGAALTSFEADLNAGDLRIDTTEGRVDAIDVSVNAGRVRIRAGDLHGTMSANAGSIELCVPPSAALRFSVEEQLTFAHNLDDRGLTRTGDVWTREGAPGGGIIDLAIDGNAANLTLDPDGGC